MKKIESRVQVLYRFRCDKCRSNFEMTEEEKIENDWKFTNYKFSRQENKWVCGPVNRDVDLRHNPLDHFDCPICGDVQIVRRGDMHRFSIMDNGREIQDY